MTQPDFGQLIIDRMIAHGVPKKLMSASSEPVLSEIEMVLPQSIRNFIQQRISDSLTTSCCSSIFDEEAVSPVPGFVKSFFDRNSWDFVEASQSTAIHLHKVQSGRNSEGLLTVAEASIGTTRGLMLMKLEKESGVTYRQRRIDGKLTFELEQAEGLTLSTGTRVFKLALFLENPGDGSPLTILVSDNQASEKSVANFFLRTFLGCVPKEAPEQTTKELYSTIESFINHSVDDPTKKAQYEMALMSEMASQDLRFDPFRFTERHFDLKYQDQLLKAITDAGLSTAEVEKDTELIEKRLQRIQYKFESGIILIGRPEVIDERVKTTYAEDGTAHVEITDKINDVRGRG